MLRLLSLIIGLSLVTQMSAYGQLTIPSNNGILQCQRTVAGQVTLYYEIRNEPNTDLVYDEYREVYRQMRYANMHPKFCYILNQDRNQLLVIRVDLAPGHNARQYDQWRINLANRMGWPQHRLRIKIGK